MVNPWMYIELPLNLYAPFVRSYPCICMHGVIGSKGGGAGRPLNDVFSVIARLMLTATHAPYIQAPKHILIRIEAPPPSSSRNGIGIGAVDEEGALTEPVAFPHLGCCWETFYIFAYCGLVGIPTWLLNMIFCSPFDVTQVIVNA